MRPRRLRTRTLLIGMLLAPADHRPAHLTRVHRAPTALPEATGSASACWPTPKHGPHLLTYRQVERTHRLLVAALD